MYTHLLWLLSAGFAAFPSLPSGSIRTAARPPVSREDRRDLSIVYELP